jgi:chitinase
MAPYGVSFDMILIKVKLANTTRYDYAGSWDSISGHQANIYPSTSKPASTPFSSDRAIKDYIAAGIPASKIVMGMPLYGRAFESTSGIGQSYSGIGSGSWENGVWDYKDLPRAGATVTYDAQVGATWSYDASTRELISFDTVDLVIQKSAYVKNLGLGGAMFWVS